MSQLRSHIENDLVTPLIFIFVVTLVLASILTLRANATDANQLGIDAFYTLIVAIVSRIVSIHRSRRTNSGVSCKRIP